MLDDRLRAGESERARPSSGGWITQPRIGESEFYQFVLGDLQPDDADFWGWGEGYWSYVHAITWVPSTTVLGMLQPPPFVEGTYGMTYFVYEGADVSITEGDHSDYLAAAYFEDYGGSTHATASKLYVQAGHEYTVLVNAIMMSDALPGAISLDLEFIPYTTPRQTGYVHHWFRADTGLLPGTVDAPVETWADHDNVSRPSFLLSSAEEIFEGAVGPTLRADPASVEFASELQLLLAITSTDYWPNWLMMWVVFEPLAVAGRVIRLSASPDGDPAYSYYDVTWNTTGFRTAGHTTQDVDAIRVAVPEATIQATHACQYVSGPEEGLQIVEVTIGGDYPLHTSPVETVRCAGQNLSRAVEPAGFAGMFVTMKYGLLGPDAGKVREVIVMTGQSEHARTGVRAYLADRYGVPG